MTLARGLPDNATEWWIYLGVLALYLLTRWLLAWRQARKEGAEHPARAAFDDDEPQETHSVVYSLGAFRTYRQLFGFAGGALLVALVAGLTDGRLQLVLMCTLAPAVVVALAYLDFHAARKRRARAGSPGTASV
ncbi:hypothetical protein [Streptomyces sp. RKAG290]|uniref:hypothetical protein n=1 Tax=Streptomyces sp. RKAG290 TaxID=2888348 RepID=UPI0020340B2F|nr:hypothetical protein [Streptomyces sp. RKAG290]MCM2412161.1 hypothetical protein [Streptomyces sp. RKAG290]